MKNKKLKSIGIVILIGLFIELFITNFSFFYNAYFRQECNILLDSSQLQYENWTVNESGVSVSSIDPIIVYRELKKEVDTLEITLDMSLTEINGVVFWTNEAHEPFSDAHYRTCTLIEGENEVQIGDYVQDLRIDIGDQSGTKLYAINVVVNPSTLNFSLFRVFSVVFISLAAYFLFKFQKPPDYGI